METLLHQQLKLHYAARPDQVEVAIDGFRIDAINARGELVEVQHAGLGAIRQKVLKLVQLGHRVRVVKPLIGTKIIQQLAPKGDRKLSRRASPKHESFVDLFTHLIHFTQAFPHTNLTLDVPILHIEETRRTRPARRWRQKPYEIVEQRLVSIDEGMSLGTHRDLLWLAGVQMLSSPFDTGQLAVQLDRPRWFAQQVAYVLSRVGATTKVGKRGNTILYAVSPGIKIQRSSRRPKRVA